HFVVESLVEAMALLSLHKERLPRPSLVPRFGSAVESRLNATDDALAPHAGGSIIAWSDCCEWEIRDDQGISLHNPDTDTFMRYDLAGAYDSNIALLVTCGDDRDQSYERLSAILRACKLRGNNLATNLEFHYGLLSWFRSHDVWAKPSTRFVSAYLAQVGMLAEAAGNVDVTAAYARLCKEAKAAGDLAPATVDEILTLKQTLLQRPLQALLGHAHVFAGWLARFRHRFAIDGGRFRWLDNPLEVLWDTYNYLNMEDWPGAPPAYVIWAHDEAMLRRGLDFYRALGDRLGGADYRAQREALASEQPPAGIDAALWSRIRSADRGHQLGLGLLAIAPLIGAECGFFELTVAEDLRCVVPERLHDPALQARMRKMLAPPPATRDGEIVAATGGMFYAQETPDSPPFIREGQHFDAGDPLYIIEVM
ncbi:MAG: biotin carboxylase, partial [Myxococcales bacterium]|nr:biotin carboxylase [Myxococcales bacterium]